MIKMNSTLSLIMIYDDILLIIFFYKIKIIFIKDKV